MTPVGTPVAVKASPTPTVEPAAESTPIASPTPKLDADGCAGKTAISVAGRSEGDEEPVYTATWNGIEVIDRGPREHAMGTVAKGPDGRLAYTVASGDGDIAISKRLCMNVYNMNSFYGFYPYLYPGDVLKVPDEMQPGVPVPYKPKPVHR